MCLPCSTSTKYIKSPKTVPLERIKNNVVSLTLASLMSKTYPFANSVESNETARNEPSHQILHYLLFGFVLLNDISI